MNKGKNIFVKIVTIIAISLIALAGCDKSTGAPDSKMAPEIFSFPYIFKGNFTVNGQPGPKGIPMFARLGNTHGIVNDTIRKGEFSNIIISPERIEDMGKIITFHLGEPDGKNVQADQLFPFEQTKTPQFLTINLTFPRLP